MGPSQGVDELKHAADRLKAGHDKNGNKRWGEIFSFKDKSGGRDNYIIGILIHEHVDSNIQKIPRISRFDFVRHHLLADGVNQHAG